MKRLQKAAVIAALAQELRDRDSWCGETHLQKNVYFLEAMLAADLGFEFVLYKHGPYSFELSDELSELRADRLLQAEPQRPPYRPRLRLTSTGERLLETYPKTVALYQDEIAFVAERLAPLGVTDLERLATAWWVTRDSPHSNVADRAKALVSLKPHVPMNAAIDAVDQVDEMAAEAAAAGVT